MERQKLKELISQNLSQREIAKTLNKSQGSIKYWLEKFNLKTNYNKYKSHLCKICGETKSDNFYTQQKTKCKTCRNLEDIQRRKKYKKEALNYFGNKCTKCGYNKCDAALEFHHPNKDEKSLEYASMKNWSWIRKKSELEKCILLCANCHREEHNK